ncbi:tRNA-binding protein [Bradyrhizobium sp. SYSU BS000235]|uniref:tRNA-binding protein n=1 Tax=Bradyrhizobium sp. SYSU BS000235 TaxID=3411332 RepID=UPI003C7322C6
MPPSPPIAYDDFAKIDLRVGRVLEVQPFPKARNPSWKVRVDLGDLGEKWSSAQITNYTADQLVGSLVVCVCNFQPRNIAGFLSEVLILGAPDPDTKIILLSPRKDGEGHDVVSPGAKVY